MSSGLTLTASLRVPHGPGPTRIALSRAGKQRLTEDQGGGDGVRAEKVSRERRFTLRRDMRYLFTPLRLSTRPESNRQSVRALFKPGLSNVRTSVHMETNANDSEKQAEKFEPRCSNPEQTTGSQQIHQSGLSAGGRSEEGGSETRVHPADRFQGNAHLPVQVTPTYLSCLSDMLELLAVSQLFPSS
ncbi:Hypothetical predicted protein [Xyrichtys novacula]|uniref:Uncharacterized protein n=1 Tax=Xyrichtys novacula TaxID=13765 RepID=A0AAV1F4C7_XYRNO|nr:Hypothetical predicted protein [Xyrichtys novacula]